MMPPQNSVESPERDQTDASLREEREKADREMTASRVAIERDADAVVEHARENADAVMVAAREKADEKADGATPLIAQSAIALDRAILLVSWPRLNSSIMRSSAFVNPRADRLRASFARP